MYPSVSVVIPVRNEVSKIRACIEGILAQSVPVKEIVVVDSGSTDGTIEILKEYGKVKLIQIPGEEFNHGQTRNVGVNYATGEFCVLTVGDARPFNNDWIKNMLDCFTDENVAGVCGSQVVPHELDKNPIEWFRPVSEPVIRKYHFTNPADFDKLSPSEKKTVCGWDDVTAMYRMSVLRKIPFQYTTFAEDLLWAKDAIQAGYTIVYNPAARVYHYHLEDPDFTFKRNFTVFYHLYKFFGYVPTAGKASLINSLRPVKTLVKESKVPLGQKLKWWRYNKAMLKGFYKAVKVFNESVVKGDSYLDNLHTELCGKPPVPKKA